MEEVAGLVCRCGVRQPPGAAQHGEPRWELRSSERGQDVADGSAARDEDVRCLYCGETAERGRLQPTQGGLGWIPAGTRAWVTGRAQAFFNGRNAIARRGRGQGPRELYGARCESCRLVCVRY